jgi:hypothetical protein
MTARPTTNQGEQVPDELTQQKLAAAAWQQLAIIGGAVTRDDTMTFSGTAWNIPAVYKGNVIEGVRDLMRYAEAQEEMIISSARSSTARTTVPTPSTAP